MSPTSQLADPTDMRQPRRVARLRAAFWAVEDALVTHTVGRARGLAYSIRNRDAGEGGGRTPSQKDATERVRVLRWIFVRANERLVCELALSTDTTCYELRTAPAARPASQTLERFTEVTAAFERQSALEGTLLADGWSLDSYDSTMVERDASAGRIAV